MRRKIGRSWRPSPLMPASGHRRASTHAARKHDGIPFVGEPPTVLRAIAQFQHPRPRAMGRRAHEHLRSLGRRREDRKAQESAPEGLTDGRPRSATTSAPATAPAPCRPQSPLRATSRATASSAFSPSSWASAPSPRFRAKWGWAHDASSTSLPRRSSSIEGESQRTIPRYRPWADARSSALAVPLAKRSRVQEEQDCLNWPYGNPGRIPEGRQC